MGELTIGDTDRIVERMYEVVNSNKDLQEKLKNVPGCKDRWMKLEEYITDHLDDIGTNIKDYRFLWIRERFFYKMQEETKMDYGFCEHFIPAFRNRTLSILTDNLSVDMDNKCTYKVKEPVITICSGTDRDNCVHLNPELEEVYNRILSNYIQQIQRRANTPWN
jgi:hypothetical protein